MKTFFEFKEHLEGLTKAESAATDYVNKDRDAHEPSYRKKNPMSDLKKASSKAAKKGVGGDVAVGRAQKFQQKRRLAKGQSLNKRPPLPEGI